MIEQLSVKDYVLFESCIIDFTNGMSVITGETGAGKSLLIDAIGYLSGDRIKSNVIRNGKDKAILSMVLTSNEKVNSILEENGDAIIENSDSVVAEIDMDEEIVEKVVYLCQKHNKKLFGVVSNMNIAIERKDLLKQFDCLICNQLESSILFSRDFKEISAEELSHTLIDELQQSEFNSLIVTLGEAGSLYVKNNGESGFCQARQIEVKDTTGAGDAFCAGASAGLTYGKSMLEAMKIGSHLASSVIASCENVCPCFSQDKFDIVKK